MSFGTKKLKKAESLTDTNPTPEQIENGTYKKGRVMLKGFPIIIENPQGSIRRGIDLQGNPWESKLTYTYGYFEKTEGSDGDEVDVFIGSEIDNNFDVYVIDQVREDTRQFDEHKVMFGFRSEQEAVKAYLSNYHKGWTGFSNISTFSLGDFRSWLKNKELTKMPVKNKKQPTMDYSNAIAAEEINIIKLRGEVLVDETLKDLISQAGDIQSGETLVLEIASPGGSVEEGLRIMLWLEYLSKKGVQIITVVTANAYSIASLIMLAADIRLISTFGEVMVHNPMVPELSYVNANELEKHINSLRELEGFMYQLYEVFTGLSREDIKLLMDNETYLKPKEAVAKGFADMVINIKKTPYEMASKQQKTVNMSKTVNVLKQVIAKINGSDAVNQLYYDNEGGAIEIYQADPSQYQVGDRVSAKDGEVQLADGSILIVKSEVIEDIKQAEIVQPEVPTAQGDEIVPEPELDEVDANASTENPTTPAEVAEIVEPQAGEFNTGPAPVAPVKSKDEMPSSVIETTESTVTTKETVAQEIEEPKAQEVEKPAEALASPGATPVVPQQEMVSMEMFQALVNQVEEMKAMVQAQGDQFKAQVEKEDEFQAAAAEAIETLAKNTSSAFKPEARITSKPHIHTMGNTIFQKAKASAGLAKK